MPKKNRAYTPTILSGFSLMLTVLIILCLVIFALLSYSSALQTQAYSQKNAQNMTEYYRADSLANERLAALQQTPEGDQVTFEIPINSRQALLVELEHSTDGSETSGDYYKIITWKKISTTQWEGNTTLPLLGSEG